MAAPNSQPSSRTNLLNGALKLIRTKGYDATSVDDLCKEAGVTKGAFFHHFESKQDLGVAATQHWNEITAKVFEQAPYHQHPDPLHRILGYIDYRAALLEDRTIPEFTCLLGTMVQETYQTNELLRRACEFGISSHAATLTADIAEAMKRRRIEDEFSAESLALYTQATLQGAFVLAKAKGGPDVARDCIAHLKRYIELLLGV